MCVSTGPRQHLCDCLRQSKTTLNLQGRGEEGMDSKCELSDSCYEVLEQTNKMTKFLTDVSFYLGLVR
jgi:hypothetical protein